MCELAVRTRRPGLAELLVDRMLLQSIYGDSQGRAWPSSPSSSLIACAREKQFPACRIAASLPEPHLMPARRVDASIVSSSAWRRNSILDCGRRLVTRASPAASAARHVQRAWPASCLSVCSQKRGCEARKARVEFTARRCCSTALHSSSSSSGFGSSSKSPDAELPPRPRPSPRRPPATVPSLLVELWRAP